LKNAKNKINTTNILTQLLENNIGLLVDDVCFTKTICRHDITYVYFKDSFSNKIESYMSRYKLF